MELQGVSGAYLVRPDGIISVPLAGNIKAAGLTTSQLEAVIGDRLRANEILTDPSVTVAVVAIHKPNDRPHFAGTPCG